MAKDRIRVLMLAGHYVPNLGYQENGWVKALTLFGVRTKVVAPAYCIPTFRGLVGHTQCRPGTREINGYELQYVPYYLNFRSMKWPRGIKAIIREFAPDVVVSVGVGQILPAAGVWQKKADDFYNKHSIAEQQIERGEYAESNTCRIISAVYNPLQIGNI